MEGVKAIADALRESGSLIKVLVGGNRLGDQGTTILCDALRESGVSKIQELSLYSNDTGPDGARAVAALCAVQASLTSLNLEWNKLGPEGAATLASGISVSSSLSALNVRGRNFLGKEGEHVLRDAVEGREGFDLKL